MIEIYKIEFWLKNDNTRYYYTLETNVESLLNFIQRITNESNNIIDKMNIIRMEKLNLNKNLKVANSYE